MTFSYDGVSEFVANMRYESSDWEMFPVLIGTRVEFFHDVNGGYNREELHHVVNLVHEVQSPESPPNLTHADQYEVHLDSYYYFTPDEITVHDEYPDEDFVISVKTTDPRSGEFSFAEELQEDIDKRVTEYSYE